VRLRFWRDGGGTAQLVERRFGWRHRAGRAVARRDSRASSAGTSGHYRYPLGDGCCSPIRPPSARRLRISQVAIAPWLLREERGLDPVEQTLEPADQLRLASGAPTRWGRRPRASTTSLSSCRRSGTAHLRALRATARGSRSRRRPASSGCAPRRAWCAPWADADQLGRTRNLLGLLPLGAVGGGPVPASRSPRRPLVTHALAFWLSIAGVLHGADRRSTVIVGTDCPRRGSGGDRS
jgi:hypothetical protein